MTKKTVSEKPDETWEQSEPIATVNNGLAERYPTGCLQITEDTPQDRWPTSMVIGSAKWKAAVLNASLTPDFQVGPDWSEPFRVVDWLVIVRESIDDKTGEIKRYPWLCMICDNGDLVGTSSEVAPHSLARALRTYTEEEWRQGVTFKIRSRKSRTSQGYYHELRVVE